MHRFFVTPDQVTGKTITITGEDHKHITKVLRLKTDEKIEICDGCGTDYIAVVQTADKNSLQAEIVDSYRSSGEMENQKITLFQGVPKGSKMENIIQKTVELGVTQVVPFISGRTVVNLKDKKDGKQKRWQRVAYEAAKQSKRGIVPEIILPIRFETMLAGFETFDLVLLAYEGETGATLKDVLTNLAFDPANVAVIVGPEGGFDREEVDAIEATGGYSVSLGRRILRTETAGVVLLAQLGFFYE